MRKTALRSIALLASLLALAACATLAPDRARQRPAALAMPDAFSAAAAEAVLNDGGNAIDAAVTAALVLAVTYPEAGNIGGGGFMLIRLDGQNQFLDYREVAPAGASRDMYLDAGGEVIAGASTIGYRAGGVPGTVAGLYAAHARHGSLPWSRLVQPAVDLAADGFVMPRQLADRIAEEAPAFAGKTNFARYFGAASAGQRFTQPELAATLRRIRDDGRNGFYSGETARLIDAQMRAGGSVLTARDLAQYQPRWRQPLRAQWQGREILAAPVPSSGGFAVIQLLKMKEALASEFAGLAHNSTQYIHLVAEMEKRVFADRAQYLGDPDFVDVPMARLISEDYIKRRAAEVNPTRISTLESARPGLEGHSTTHFSIVDRHGNAVANTYTINTWFGSGAVVSGAGFLLNNEMDDFSVKPGVANFYGVVGGTANEIAPNKRMLSSMSPTILLDKTGVAAVVGTPGGSTIFTSVFQTLVNVTAFGMTPQEAVGASRFHHQLLPPDLITYSPSRPLPETVRTQLATRGYRALPHSFEFGDVQLIWWDGTRYLAASDPRGRGVSRVLTTGGTSQ